MLPTAPYPILQPSDIDWTRVARFDREPEGTVNFYPRTCDHGEGANLFNLVILITNWFYRWSLDYMVFLRFLYATSPFLCMLVDKSYITMDFAWTLLIRGIHERYRAQILFYLFRNAPPLDFTSSYLFDFSSKLVVWLFLRTSRRHRTFTHICLSATLRGLNERVA